MPETPGAQPIHRLRLHQELLAKLRSMILRCELVPGTRISEKDLCTRFAISRTPLREALKVLAANGLIELLPNRGAWIPHLRAKDVVEVFDLLPVLERRAGELAAPRLTDRDLRELRSLHDRMIAQGLADDTEKWHPHRLSDPSQARGGGRQPDAVERPRGARRPGRARSLHRRDLESPNAGGSGGA